MKALKITLTHGRIFTAETSDGKRATAATLAGAMEQLIPASLAELDFDFEPLSAVFDSIRDSGGDGQFQKGRAGA